MSKKSMAELSVAPSELDRRLPPPVELSPVETQLWQSIVATKPSDWFQADCAPVLVSYCKHISTAMILDEMIAKTGADDVPKFLALIDERRKETGKIESTATKLRLTPQARYNTQAAATADRKGGNSKKPWD